MTTVTAATYQTAAANTAVLGRATEADNRMKWDGQPGHYEVWYVTLNQRSTRTGFWIRSVIEAPLHGPARAEVWFGFYDHDHPKRGFGIHQAFPIAALSSQTSPFKVVIGENEFSHGGVRGRLAGDGHTAEWDLQWLPAAETHRHAADIFYKRKLASTTILAPNLAVPVRGRVVVDGRAIEIEGEPGGQTHLWGKKHASAWGWGHCNAFDAQRGAALECLTVRLERRGLVLPPMTAACLYLDGEALRFTGLGNILVNRGSTSTARYTFSAFDRHAKIAGEFTCRPEDMVLAEYDDPDGAKVYCNNTCVGDVSVTVWRRDRPWQKWREAARLRAPRAGAFEVAGRSPDPAITRKHVSL